MAIRKIYKVKIKTASGDYIGIFHSPFPEKRLSDAISRLDGYVNLKEVTLTQTGEKYPFVIINKNSIEMIILMDEKTDQGDLAEEI
jgi:hypothetical protein